MIKQAGFTLIELMVTLAVAAIMMSFGVPKITGMLQGDRYVASLNSLSAHLNYARNEAVKRSITVSVAALDPAKPDEWDLGWVVFVDNSGDGILDAGEQQLRIINALNIPKLTIRPKGAINSVTYDRLGAAPGNGFKLLESGYTTVKSLTISATGHVSIDQAAY